MSSDDPSESRRRSRRSTSYPTIPDIDELQKLQIHGQVPRRMSLNENSSDFRRGLHLQFSIKIRQIFQSIKTSQSHSDLQKPGLQDSTTNSYFEVNYMSRVKVGKCKKFSSLKMDEIIDKVEAEVARVQMEQQMQQQRRRHASLPDTLVDEMHQEKLREQRRILNHSPRCGSNDTFSSPPSSSPVHMEYRDSDSSRDDLSEDGISFNRSRLGSDSAVMNLRPRNRILDIEIKSTIAVLQIARNVFTLISLVDKNVILEADFSRISSVTQGQDQKEYFSLIVRDFPHSTESFSCHVIKCLNGEIAQEIMSNLGSAFNALDSRANHTRAHSGTPGRPTQEVCPQCPLHQLQRLAHEISELSHQAAWEHVRKTMDAMPEKEMIALRQFAENESPETFEESVEVVMIQLRKICDQKQREHMHVSEGSRSGRTDLNLHPEEKHNIFDRLGSNVKKSLTTSFESIIRGRKTQESHHRDEFRQRSLTLDSDSSLPSRDSSSATTTPEASPSPFTNESFDFNSPPSSPISPSFHKSRVRSATASGVDSGLFSSPNSTKLKPSSSLLQQPPHTSTPTASPSATAPRNKDVNHNTTNKALSRTRSPSIPPDVSQDSSDMHSSISDHHRIKGLGRLGRTDSFRKRIYDRVCTPKAVDTDPEQSHADKEKTKEEVCALWRKAFLETLLLIRMEKENHNTRARQEDDEIPTTRKLEYEELTPCLKSITGTWESLLETGDDSVVDGEIVDQQEPVDPDELINCVKTDCMLPLGVPRELRGQIWLFLMHQKQKQQNSSNGDCAATTPYETLLKQLTTHQHSILIDLGRTFPSHAYFSKALGPGQLELFNLLKAYSLLDREVGYCQGLSFIVGMLLMHMEEVSAFHVLKYMMYDLGLRKQYRPNMMALQIKLYQLTRLLHDHYPELFNHFDTHEISPTLYAAPWFLTLFASQFPLGFVARVFDMIFVQGDVALFKIALKLLGNHRALILQCNSFEETVDFLKTTLPVMVQVQMERIINQAFELDISQQLATYEVEYKMFSEETTFTAAAPPKVPSRPGYVNQQCQTVVKLEFLEKLEEEKQDLMDKLQHAQSQQRSLDHEVHAQKIELDKLRSDVQTLNLERRSLLAAVAELHSLIPAGALASRLAEKESGQILNLASLSSKIDELKEETSSQESRTSSVEMSSSGARAPRVSQSTSVSRVASSYQDSRVPESSSSSSMVSSSSVHSSSSLQSMDMAQIAKNDKRLSNR